MRNLPIKQLKQDKCITGWHPVVCLCRFNLRLGDVLIGLKRSYEER